MTALVNSLAGLLSPTGFSQNGLAPAPPQWIYVSSRFQRFLSNIEPTDNQEEDVFTKAAGIMTCLNNRYWPQNLLQGRVSTVLAGSWAKKTRARPSSDLDLIYLLPYDVYWRFENRQGNKQSAILQEIKAVLQVSYPDTEITCDGPTVIMKFATYKVEIAPAFRNLSAPDYIFDPQFQVFLCDTNQNGRYKLAAPAAERDKVMKYNAATNGDLIPLIRMLKTWRRNCNVPIKAFLLEQLAMEFLAQWPNTGKGIFWYDWMVRDFFAFMIARRGGYGALPVSNELFFYGDQWVSRAETAWKNAARACAYEQLNYNEFAGDEWQKIFGFEIPKAA